MKPIMIQRCANGVILSPIQQQGDPAPIPTDIFVFTDGSEQALIDHLKTAIKPITRIDLTDVKAALEQVEVAVQAATDASGPVDQLP